MPAPFRLLLVLIATAVLPVILLIEIAVLGYMKWQYWRHDLDRRAREEGWFWSRKLAGLLAQDLWAWVAGALVVTAVTVAQTSDHTVAAICLYFAAVAIIWPKMG